MKERERERESCTLFAVFIYKLLICSLQACVHAKMHARDEHTVPINLKLKVQYIENVFVVRGHANYR